MNYFRGTVLDNEQQRFHFLVNRDGMEAALVFAEQTMKSYRRAVLSSHKRGYIKPHHGSLKEYRRSFICSYVYNKRQYHNRHQLLDTH